MAKKKKKSYETKKDALEAFAELRADQRRQLEYHRHLIDYFALRCIEHAMYRTEMYERALPDLPRARTKEENEQFELACSFILEYYAGIDEMINGKMTFPLPPEKKAVQQLTRRKR